MPRRSGLSIAAVASLALIVAAGTVPGARAEDAAATSLPADAFVRESAMNGLFDIETSRLAMERSKNPSVTSLAQRIVSDRGDLNNALKMTTRAVAPGVSMPASLDPERRAAVDAMREKTGADFDAAYLEAQTQSHQRAMALLASYARSGDKPELKHYAEEALAKLRSHQDVLGNVEQR